MIGRRALGLLAMASLAATACSQSSGAAACSEPERIVEAGNVHVLPGAEVTFDLSPPTSGPHEIPAPPAGVHGDPISEPRQVAAIESGMVILQHGSEVAAADVHMLRALADDRGVIVAPGARAFDDGASIAFTAWGTRQLCSGLDLAAAESFVDRYLGVSSLDHGD